MSRDDLPRPPSPPPRYRLGPGDARQPPPARPASPMLDRVLGGRPPPRSVVLVRGRARRRKSRPSFLEWRPRRRATSNRTLYGPAGEEVGDQVGCAPTAIRRSTTDLYLAAETDLATILGHLDAVKPSLLILGLGADVPPRRIDGAPAGMAQVREGRRRP